MAEISYSNRASSKVWSTPELVSIIASNASQPSLASLARVNKAISDLSLARLYRYLGFDFQEIFAILAPMEPFDDRGLVRVSPYLCF